VKLLGATHTINYKTSPAWEEDVLALTEGIGVNLVVEQGGASTFLQSVKTLRRGSRLSQVGLLTTESKGDFMSLVMTLIMKQCHIV
jgi:NADPH:quinone reductase-like Zn-dependent oxidoreductase